MNHDYETNIGGDCGQSADSADNLRTRPTPETDAAQHEGLLRGHPTSTLVVRASFARRLELQRDEARELAQELRDLLQDWRRFWKDNSTKSSSATWSDGQGILTSTVRLIDKAKEVLP